MHFSFLYLDQLVLNTNMPINRKDKTVVSMFLSNSFEKLEASQLDMS